jgi:cyclopropane-fatty-acyl-phospholipid synthase
MLRCLGENAHVSCPVTCVRKVRSADATEKYELFKGDDKESLGLFDEVIFACHTPDAVRLLQDDSQCDMDLLETLSKIQYEDNIVYVHSDPSLMPKSKSAWASWNCLGKSEFLNTNGLQQHKKGEAMEGGESGFGNKVENEGNAVEGENGRMKAVYVTYYLNKLQNLKTDTDIFVSLNPHQKPDQSLVYKKRIMAHPQFTPETTQARERIANEFQGENGLWFCGAWQGYGFHEDGCRGGFEVATSMSGISLPWCNQEGQQFLSPPNLVKPLSNDISGGIIQKLLHFISYTIPTSICKKMVVSFLNDAVKKGRLSLKLSDDSVIEIGDGTPCGCDDEPVTLRIFDDWFFVKIAMEYDLGLARSYMSGYFNVESLHDPNAYDQVIRPNALRNESNIILGDPVGLTRLFHLFVGNRDSAGSFEARRSAKQYPNAFMNAAGLFLAKFGSFLSFLKYRITMDNSEKGGSLKNIHAHYDLSNDLFRTFLDKETLMYSSAIYDGIKLPAPQSKLVFRGSLEEAEVRKLDTLLTRAQIQPGQTMLDIGFGWGGLSIHAARKFGCHVTGITLSVEQKALAEERVKNEGLGHLITFEVIDYRTFARRKENKHHFDRVLSCEMIEAVGHDHLGEFFWAVEQVLKSDGVLVMEAITTPESRYETYLRYVFAIHDHESLFVSYMSIPS